MTVIETAALPRPDGTVVCTLKPLLHYARGGRKGWVASDDDATRFWRAEYLGNQTFRLTGGPVADDSFGPKRVLRLWECGVGDEVRHRLLIQLGDDALGRVPVEVDVGEADVLP